MHQQLPFRRGLPRIAGTARRMQAGLRGLACGLLIAATAAVAQTAAPLTAAPTLIEVHAGDTFSAIAARFTGDARNWARLYNAQLSRLPNPNLILVGMQLELVTEASGGRYLRLVSEPGGRALPVAKTPLAAPSKAAAAPAAPAPATPAAVTPAAPLANAAAAPGDDALVVGVLPNIGAAALLAQYESLKTYLERGGGQKVRIVVPANFKAFFDNTMRGDYDLAVAAPHFARVAQLDRGMVPLAMYEPRIAALFLTPIDSAISGPRDVRGKAVAFANPTSLVAMFGQQWLRQQSLEPGKDYEVKGANSDMGVGRMLLSGDAVAAIMSNGEFRALPPDESSRMKIVESFARIPNFILVAHPRLGGARLERLKSQLKGFLSDKDEGAAFSRSTGITGIVEAEDAVMRELDPFAPLTRRAMGLAN